MAESPGICHGSVCSVSLRSSIYILFGDLT